MRITKKFWAILAILFLAAWITFLFIVGPRTIIESVGINNTYFIIFGIGALGGVSSFTGAVFFSAFAAALAGGAESVLLIIAGGIGLTIGDSIFYLLASYGYDVTGGSKLHRYLDRFKGWLAHRREGTVQAVAFGYIGFTPLPNDILMVSLALADYPYKKILPSLLAGETVFLSLLTLLTKLGLNIF